MLISEIIRSKRDGNTLDRATLSEMANAIADGRASDAQVAAFAMAVFFKDMTLPETADFTLALRDSGEVLDWSDLPGPVTDKHSTGGVGDNVSLMLAPIVAACGAFVPMISGRGLGHTGGTLDKLESIPGYQIEPDIDRFRHVVRKSGCAIIGQTADLAPADRRLYAVRDVTATVEANALITASILSKKFAAGLDSLVLDVKTGNGAFMENPEDARALAQTLTSVAQMAGLSCHALITDMGAPLADAAGNALEVAHAVDFLTGKEREPRMLELVLSLADEKLVLAGLADTPEQARHQTKRALESGRATEHFASMVRELGGPGDFVERSSTLLPEAPVIREVTAQESGHVRTIATRDIGMGVIALGGGRRKASDDIDHRVGFAEIAPVGRKLSRGDLIGMVHAASEAHADAAVETLRAAYEIGDAIDIDPVVLDRIT